MPLCWPRQRSCGSDPVRCLHLLGHDPESLRAFVGYVGWGAGQLEKEMKQKAWLVHKPTPAALQPGKLSKLWFDIMRGLGPWYKMLAAAPDDPSLN